MRITVITSIAGGYERLREDFKESDARHIAFLDEDSMIEAVGIDLWDCRECDISSDEPRRNAKIHKIIPHKFIDLGEDDISIWIDGNVSLNITPQELADLWLKDKDIAVCKHFERDCVYEEAEACKMSRLDNPVLINQQMKRYKQAGYPENNGLCECGLIVRRHTPEINALSEQWWEEVKNGSSRDQLSFNYVFDKELVSAIDDNIRFSKLFNYEDHLKISNNDYLKYYG